MESVSSLNQRTMASPVASLFFLWVLLVGVTGGFCADPAPKGYSTADVNHLTDDILAGIKTYATYTNLTAINLPDVKQDFSFTMLWILSLAGRIQLTEGSLRNFQNVDRLDNSQLTFLRAEGASGQLILQTGIKLPKIEGSYDFTAKAGVVSQKGKIGVSVSGVKANTTIVMDMDTLTPAMLELKIVNLGKIKVKIQDGIGGWLLSPITNLIVSIMQRTLKDTLEVQLPPIINKFLEQLDIAGMIRPPTV